MLKKTLQAVVVLGVLTLAAPTQAGWFDNNNSAPAPTLNLQSGVMMPHARTVTFFEHSFTDQNGQRFDASNLQKHWTLVFFGFTYCPMLCPTTMAELSNAYQQLAKDGVSPLPQIVFITIDPARDTQAAVKTFITAFNPHFIGLRMTDTAILGAFARQLDASYEKINASGKDKDVHGHYTYTHTGDIAVINPQGEFVAMLTMPHLDKNIVVDYKTLVNA